MKKILLSIISMCAIFCGIVSCQKETRPAVDLSSPTHFVENGVEFTITAGAPFQTKAEDGDFVTVTGRSNYQVATLVCENIEYSNGTTICRQFNEEGVLLATMVFSEDLVLDLELSDLVLAGDDDYVTRAKDDDEEEKLGECIKRMYKELKAELVENNRIACELSLSAAICSAVAEVAAIAKCL